ncbi:MAG: hypothetical protein NZZ60_05665 [Bacteroidia bacterium]|nr:hypothetical protein [Bacteroidia bacterium]MCX7652284.1 hypothetical protein [Bacteroidia bacterium]MDW8416546.1 hypothetical protein [Bacteroidia bacterium]
MHRVILGFAIGWLSFLWKTHVSPLPEYESSSQTSNLAEVWVVRVLFEGKDKGEVELHFIYPSEKKVIRAFVSQGQAQISMSLSESLKEVVAYGVGHLPVRLMKISHTKRELDFTDPKNLHPNSGYILRQGRAYLAAGELGQLPEQPNPIINAYDVEMFLIAQKQQDLRADFNDDGRVDEGDFHLLVKNQNRLLQTEL